MSLFRYDLVLDVVSLARSSGALRPRSVSNELGSRPRLQAPSVSGFTWPRFSEPNAAHRLLQHTTTREHTQESSIFARVFGGSPAPKCRKVSVSSFSVTRRVFLNQVLIGEKRAAGERITERTHTAFDDMCR